MKKIKIAFDLYLLKNVYTIPIDECKLMHVFYATVVYEKGMQYFEDYINSMKLQTFSDFKIVLLNQNVGNLSKYLDKFASGLNIEILDASTPFSISNNFNQLIANAINNEADTLIFGDLDDYFHENRIKSIINKIQAQSFVYHDFTLTNAKGIPFSNSGILGSNKKIPNYLSTPDPILEYNFIGTNTALNLAKIAKFIPLTDNLIAVDWAIFSQFLIKNHSGAYIPEVLTYYRQHHNNTVGLNTYFTKNLVLRGINAKIYHYSYLSQIDSDWKEIYQNLHAEILELRDYCKNSSNLIKYINNMISNFQDKKFLWWENIKPLKKAFNYGN